MSEQSTVWCVVVAGGSGSRYGRPKQFDELAGARILDRAVATAAGVCDGVVVALPEDVLDTAAAEVPGAAAVVAGGPTRTASALAGLRAVPPDADVVLVHDAARPLAGTEVFERVIAAVRAGASCVVPAVPVTDTIRTTDGTLVDRGTLRAVQTPQGFAAALLRTAHERAAAEGVEATDDAELVARNGEPVTLVEGDVANLKVTGPHDMAVAEALLAHLGASS